MCTCYISGRGKGFDMKTLKDASIGQTVKVKKLTGEGPYHGYGNHKGR